MFFDILYLTDAVLLEVQSGLLGDFDTDGDVDGQDFVFVFWPQGMSPKPLSQSDLDDWEQHYGTAFPLLGAAAAIPEASSLVLALLAVITGCILQKQVFGVCRRRNGEDHSVRG